MAEKVNIIEALDMQPGESITISKHIDGETYVVKVENEDGEWKSKEIYAGSWIAKGLDQSILEAADKMFRELL